MTDLSVSNDLLEKKGLGDWVINLHGIVEGYNYNLSETIVIFFYLLLFATPKIQIVRL